MQADDAALSLATSGDYRNFIEEDGKKVSHLFNAQTLQPIEHNVVSVSVLHESCAWADGWATALNVVGAERGLAIAEAEDLPVSFLLYRDEGLEEIASSAFAAYRSQP